jgi:hypothetical protein
MGWLWNTSKPAVPATPAEAPASTPAFEPPAAPPESRQQLSREEQANEDLVQLMKEIEAEFDTARDQRIQSRKSGVLSHTSPLPDDISPDSLYPTEISCRSAFDYAMFCQSFGGQFVNIYRYGTFRSCSNHWDDFWLCMRTKQWDEKDRAKTIKDHYRKKAVKWKTGPSSEDIWSVRTEPVKDAFQDNLEELEAKIEQWKKANADKQDPWADQKGFKGKEINVA